MVCKGARPARPLGEQGPFLKCRKAAGAGVVGRRNEQGEVFRTILIVAVRGPEGDASAQTNLRRDEVVVRRDRSPRSAGCTRDVGLGKHPAVRGLVAIARGVVALRVLRDVHPVVRRVARGAFQQCPTLRCAVFEVIDEIVSVAHAANGDGATFGRISRSRHVITVDREVGD